MVNPFEQKSEEKKDPVVLKDIPHYYGDTVRMYFFVAGIIMLVGLPFFADRIHFTVFAAILGAVFVVLFAGLTNPSQRGVIFFDVIVSLVGLIIFELTTIDWYQAIFGIDIYLIFNQLLALAFFVTFYFSIKTYRAMSLHKLRRLGKF